jgi:hypothetical protein
MNVSKIVTLIMWLGLAASFFIPGEASWIGWCQIAFWGLAAAHFAEFLIYIPTLNKVGGSMPRHFVGVMLYGFFYYQEIKPAPEEQA